MFVGLNNVFRIRLIKFYLLLGVLLQRLKLGFGFLPIDIRSIHFRYDIRFLLCEVDSLGKLGLCGRFLEKKGQNHGLLIKVVVLHFLYSFNRGGDILVDYEGLTSHPDISFSNNINDVSES